MLLRKLYLITNYNALLNKKLKLLTFYIVHESSSHELYESVKRDNRRQPKRMYAKQKEADLITITL